MSPSDSIDWDDVHAARADGVRIVVVDSGVDAAHTVFAGRPVASWQVVGGEAPTVIEDDAGDVFGHGTAVASIVHRLAPGATIESLRVLGGDLRSQSRAVLAGLRWALDRRYDIINCSFGTTSRELAPHYKDFVDDAFCRGALVVAAGNNHDIRRTSYPASFPTVLSTDYGALAELAIARRAGQLVEFIAPGEAVRVAWKGGGWRENTGCSLAAAHLAGIVARIRGLRPGWNACQIKAALYALAEALPAPDAAGPPGLSEISGEARNAAPVEASSRAGTGAPAAPGSGQDR